jgi:hypothetical protein
MQREASREKENSSSKHDFYIGVSGSITLQQEVQQRKEIVLEKDRRVVNLNLRIRTTGTRSVTNTYSFKSIGRYDGCCAGTD